MALSAETDTDIILFCLVLEIIHQSQDFDLVKGLKRTDKKKLNQSKQRIFIILFNEVFKATPAALEHLSV